MKKKVKRLRTRKEFIKAILDYHKIYYTDGGFTSIFSLQRKMLEIGICPRCGTKSRCYSSSTCWDCGFKITENEADKVIHDKKKYILKRRLKGKMKIDER